MGSLSAPKSCVTSLRKVRSVASTLAESRKNLTSYFSTSAGSAPEAAAPARSTRGTASRATRRLSGLSMGCLQLRRGTAYEDRGRRQDTSAPRGLAGTEPPTSLGRGRRVRPTGRLLCKRDSIPKVDALFRKGGAEKPRRRKRDAASLRSSELLH